MSVQTLELVRPAHRAVCPLCDEVLLESIERAALDASTTIHIDYWFPANVHICRKAST